MKKVVDLNPRTRMNKQHVEAVIDLIREIPPEKINSLAVFISADPPESPAGSPEQLYVSRISNPHYGLLGYMTSEIHEAYMAMKENLEIDPDQNPYDPGSA